MTGAAAGSFEPRRMLLLASHDDDFFAGLSLVMLFCLAVVVGVAVVASRSVIGGVRAGADATPTFSDVEKRLIAAVRVLSGLSFAASAACLLNHGVGGALRALVGAFPPGPLATWVGVSILLVVAPPMLIEAVRAWRGREPRLYGSHLGTVALRVVAALYGFATLAVVLSGICALVYRDKDIGFDWSVTALAVFFAYLCLQLLLKLVALAG